MYINQYVSSNELAKELIEEFSNTIDRKMIINEDIHFGWYTLTEGIFLGYYDGKRSFLVAKLKPSVTWAELETLCDQLTYTITMLMI